METTAITDQLPGADLTGEPVPPPTRDELIARAGALRAQLDADAAEVDRERRLTDRGVNAITSAGLTRLMTPSRLGGYQTDSRTVLEVTTEIGRGCGSSAWVTAVYNSGNFMVGLFPDRARADVWYDNPDARTSMVLVTPKATVDTVDGGIVISGSWGFASGSLHCGWIVLLVGVPDEQGVPQQNLVLVPIGELTVKDTWLVTGMRGTGSNTVVADQVFVPSHRVMPYAPIVNGQRPNAHADEWLYRSSLSGVLQVFLLGSMIGEASTALSYVLEKAPKRSIASSTYAHQTDSVAFQIDVAEAASMIDTAQLHAGRLADLVDSAARLGEELDVPARARMRMDATHAVTMCRKAIDLLMTAHGTSAFAEVSPLQRIWRDINVGSRHGGFGARIPQEVYGKALLGIDPRQTSYLL